MTKVIDKLVKDGEEITSELLSFLSPYLTEHIKRFGQYFLDTGDIPTPLELLKLAFLEK